MWTASSSLNWCRILPSFHLSKLCLLPNFALKLPGSLLCSSYNYYLNYEWVICLKSNTSWLKMNTNIVNLLARKRSLHFNGQFWLDLFFYGYKSGMSLMINIEETIFIVELLILLLQFNIWEIGILVFLFCTDDFVSLRFHPSSKHMKRMIKQKFCLISTVWKEFEVSNEGKSLSGLLEQHDLESTLHILHFKQK